MLRRAFIPVFINSLNFSAVSLDDVRHRADTDVAARALFCMHAKECVVRAYVLHQARLQAVTGARRLHLLCWLLRLLPRVYLCCSLHPQILLHWSW